MTDNYEYARSSRPQNVDDYSPYIEKQANNYINDLNSSIYTNNSLSLVQFDLGQIYNSQKFTDTNDLYCVIPITIVAAFANAAGAILAPTSPGLAPLCSIKTNNINLIHQADLQIQGKTIEPTQPYINIAKHFKMMSEMSINDLKQMGPTLGFGDDLDNYRSVAYNTTIVGAGATNGNGFTNNKIFGSAFASGIGSGLQTTFGSQNLGCVNTAASSKISRVIDATGNTANKVVPNIVTLNQLDNEFRPTYRLFGNYMVWTDYAVIKLNTLFESLQNIGLVRKLDATLRLWVNTGAVGISSSNENTVVAGSNAAVGVNLKYNYKNTNSTFTNTCPLLINYVNDYASGTNVTAGTVAIVAGLFIGKPPTTNIFGINLGASGASHPMQACRIYYSQITINPIKALTYIENNRNKKVVYRNIISNQYSCPATGSFNQLINSGIVHPTGVLIVPFISAKVADHSDYQWKSPFDTCPATSSPISLTNLQVSVGGTNILSSNLYYNYESFIQQVSLADTLTSADFGVSCGLFNQSWWETFRYYYVNVERSALADKNVPRNINISFNNNSNVEADIMVFIFYSDNFIIDVESGIINK